jgi:hypothetical protein
MVARDVRVEPEQIHVPFVSLVGVPHRNTDRFAIRCAIIPVSSATGEMTRLTAKFGLNKPHPWER